jgi:hypothetical protein
MRAVKVRVISFAGRDVVSTCQVIGCLICACVYAQMSKRMQLAPPILAADDKQIFIVAMRRTETSIMVVVCGDLFGVEYLEGLLTPLAGSTFLTKTFVLTCYSDFGR